MSKHDNEKILTVDDLADRIPFFRTPLGQSVGRWLMRHLGVDKINTVYGDLMHLEGADFAAAALRHPQVNVSYRIHGEEYLEQMRSGGRFITLSNHPFGGLDGLILLDIVGHAAPDFKVLANVVLSLIPSLRSMWVPVFPNMEGSIKSAMHDPMRNFKSLRRLMREFEQGYPVGLFPAGGVGRISPLRHLPIERPWKSAALRMIRMADCTIFPVMFDGRNSVAFYYLKANFPTISDMMLPTEIFKKSGQTIDVYIGAPIEAEEWRHIGEVDKLREYLMRRCLAVLPRAMYELTMNGHAHLVRHQPQPYEETH